MASLLVNIPHQLAREEALNRIKGLLQKLKEEQGDKISNMREEWNGTTGLFQFTAQGFDLSGEIQVNPSNVEITGKLPFALSFFKGKISNMISEKASELLS